MRSILGLLVAGLLIGDAPLGAATYYLSSAGSDSNDGLSVETPWRTLKRVDEFRLSPGDRVFFRRGDAWRGWLTAQSGEEGRPVTYSAYGSGERPRLLGAVSRDAAADWEPEGGNVWTTPKPGFAEQPPLADFPTAGWSLFTESGAAATCSQAAPGTWSVTCTAGGTAPHHILLGREGLRIEAGDAYVFVFRARCAKPFPLPSVFLMQPAGARLMYAYSPPLDLRIGPEWETHTVRLEAQFTADDAKLILSLGALPAGAALEVQPVSWTRLASNHGEQLSRDVGNIVFDGGRSVGVKKWALADLRQPGDFWYCPETSQVKLCSEGNPAETHRSIELALNRAVVEEEDRHDVVYEGLSISLGGAHGIAGGNTRRIAVRDCDLSWLGGGYLFTAPNGVRVRFGNGIEFWGNAQDNLVEGCRLWEIYDAALTNQSSTPCTQSGIAYRDNVVWHAEYSFEYWNNPKESVTRDIRFEHNTCVGAGLGWSHAQRSDPNGRHLMFFENAAATAGVRVEDNIFSAAADSGMRMWKAPVAGLTLDRNCWFQPQGVLMLYLDKPFPPEAFADYQKESGYDARSIVADPRFHDPDRLDFTPAEAFQAYGSRKRLVQ